MNCADVALSVFYTSDYLLVLDPCFNVLADIFVVMNCSVVALSAVFCFGLLTWSADTFKFITVTYCTTTSKESACRIICMLCQQT